MYVQFGDNMLKRNLKSRYVNCSIFSNETPTNNRTDGRL